MQTLLTSYGLTAALSMALALCAAGLYGRRKGVGYGPWIRLCVLALPLSFLFSRLLFALTAWGRGDAFSAPVQMLYFWDGGASITGAFIGGVIAAALTEKLCRIPRGTLMDGIALGMPVALMVERLAEPAMDLGVGRYVDTDWLAFLGDATGGRHPVYLYEALAAAVILLVLLIMTLRRGGVKRPGDLLLTFLTLYGCTQVLFESLRDDEHMLIYFIRINQVAALIMVLVAFVIWMIRWAHKGAGKGGMLLSCSLVLYGIVQSVIQEFAVDSNPNLLLEYGIMALSLALIAAVTLTIRRKAE